MGFTADTAATVNGDLLKYAFEQQIANLLRGGNTFDELHKGAINDLIRWLRTQGYSTTDVSGITNTEDWKPALVYWVLSKIFAGQGSRSGGANAARLEAMDKANYYERLAEQTRRSTAIVLSDASVRQRRGLPIGVNVDSGTNFPPLGGARARPTTVAGDEISGYDNLMLEGK